MVERVVLRSVAVIFLVLLIHRGWPNSGEQHHHRTGIHGGVIFPIGRERFHVEAVFGTDGLLRLYTLEQDECQLLEVDNQSPMAHITSDGSSDQVVVQLHPEPQIGDPVGSTSRFCAQISPSTRKLRIDVPDFRVRGERFNLTFTLDSVAHVPQMPTRVAADTEYDLYLKPGGIYTAADIRANGFQVPSKRFIAFKAKHDSHPKPGDTLCPVTRTKAHPECTWVIGGKTHHFCCPPCIDEYLTQAKARP